MTRRVGVDTPHTHTHTHTPSSSWCLCQISDRWAIRDGATDKLFILVSCHASLRIHASLGILQKASCRSNYLKKNKKNKNTLWTEELEYKWRKISASVLSFLQASLAHPSARLKWHRITRTQTAKQQSFVLAGGKIAPAWWRRFGLFELREKVCNRLPIFAKRKIPPPPASAVQLALLFDVLYDYSTNVSIPCLTIA